MSPSRVSMEHHLILTEALRLAGAGFHVGITAPEQKRPHPALMAKGDDGSSGGVWKSTTDVGIVRSWWQCCPDGGLSVSPRDQLVALDVDDPTRFEEIVGPDVAQQMQVDYPCTRTPSGGLHIWFHLPATKDVKRLPRNLEFGEFIYEGFYALVPPSKANNKNGELGSYTVITALPDEIDRVPIISEDHLERILSAVDQFDITVKTGRRHDTLLQTGMALARAGKAATEIETALRELNASFTPPMVPGELQREIDGIVRWLVDQALLSSSARSASPKVELLSMQNLTELPAPRWLILNLIPDGGLGVLISAPGGGKSFFLLTLAMSVCRGVPLFGESDLMPTRVGWVLVLLPEAARSWAARIQAYLEYHGTDYSDNFVCCVQQNDLADTATWERVITAIQEQASTRGCPPVLVIVDTLSASIPGRDENVTKEMSLLTSHLQELVAMGSCVVVAHHPTKYTTHYRGSSGLLGSCDWMISILELPGGVREFRADKLRDVESITSKTFVIQKYADSAVCVGTGAQGPWSLLDSLSKVHPGLKEALLSLGLVVPGDIQHTACDCNFTGSGVSLKHIKEAWRKATPVTPANRDDPRGYKAVDRGRTTALIRVVRAMLDAGVLEVVTGKVSKSDRNLDGVVRQVLADEDV